MISDQTPEARGAAADGTPAFEARLFGAFALVASDGSIATPTGRKARALLACLLLAGPDGMPRERLTALLWSKRAEEQARASLRQTLYEMRALGGERPLLSVDRLSVRVEARQVRSDLDRFGLLRSSADAGALAQLVGDQPRDLLMDLGGVDDGFDEWLAIERERRGDERRVAMLAVADAALGSGDAAGAHRLAMALLGIDATDERAARLAMHASHLSGDRDGARQIMQRLDKALRLDFGTEPTQETLDLQRHLAAVVPASPTTARVSSPAVAAAAALPRPRSLSRHVVLASALLLVGVCAAAAWGWQAASRGPVQPVVLVRPLAVSAADAAALALVGGLSTDLARMTVGNDATLRVVDADEPSGVTPRRIDFVVTGDAHDDAGTLRVNIKLQQSAESTILWSSRFARPASETEALREQIATKVADVLVCGLGGRHPAPDTFGEETLRLYLGACEQKHADWAESAKLLQQVVARQPKFAHGWAMLAAGTTSAAYLRPDQSLELHRQAEVYAQHALALDPNDGEAYYARADAMPGIENWTKRVAILQAGHAVDPTNAPVNGTLGWNLALVGRWREAIAATRQGVDFDPFSPGQISMLAQLLGLSGDASQADEVLEIGRKRFPTWRSIARTEFRIQALVGDPQRAAAMLADARRPLGIGSEDAAAWAELIAARSDPTPARVDAAVRTIVALANATPTHLLPAIEKLVVLHRIDAAYALADRAGQRSGREDQHVLFSSALAPLRADPRFMTLAARQGLAAVWLQTNHWPDFCLDPKLPYDCRVEARRALTPQARLLAAVAAPTPR